MPELACKDVNEDTCDFVASEDTSESAAYEMLAHLQASHTWNVGELSVEEQRQLIEPWNKYIAVR